MNYFKLKNVLSFFMVLFLLSACNNQGQQQQKAEPDYKETKTMVLDILKTDEGKKAIQETIKEPGVLMKEATIQSTVEKTLTDPKNQQGFKEMMKDPKVAESFAKAIQDEHKKIIKDLMKDPEYQQMLIKVMKDPKFEENLLEVMNSSAYRQQAMSIMKDSLESPMFKIEMIDLMVEAQKEAMKPEKKEKGGGGEGGGGGGGGGGGK